MSFILSAQRDVDDFETGKARWESYRSYLHSLKGKFPARAYEIATSNWWYRFDLPEAPHDSRLLSFRLGDHGAATYDNRAYSWIEIDLQSAFSGTIHLKYPMVYRYSLNMSDVSAGIHGDWRYDEFSLTEEGHLLHTIEWADGAVWSIEASDIDHSYTA